MRHCCRTMNNKNLHSLVLRSHDLIYTSLSKFISSAPNSTELQKAHSLIIILGLHNSVYFSGKLISRYSQFKTPLASLAIFHRISPKKNVYLWNTIIRAMTHNGLFSKALEFYTQMKVLNVRPDKFTYPSVINSCAGLLDLNMGRIVHNDVADGGFVSDLYICNALIDMYSRLDELVTAHNVFDGMPCRDLVSWNSLISGYSSNGHWDEALEAFHKLRVDGMVPDAFTVSSVLQACGGLAVIDEGKIVHGLVEKIGIKRDVIVSNGVISMYFKCDMLMDCQKIFDEMEIRDTVSWNTMICGYSQSGMFGESINFFLQMVHSFQPDIMTITSVLRACGQMKDLNMARYVHNYLVTKGYDCDTTAYNIIIHMYVKCGDLSAAKDVFDSMKSKDLVSWNSIINGYVENSLYVESINIFNTMKMELVEPDCVTYVMLISMSLQLANQDYIMQLQCDVIKNGLDCSLLVGNALVDAYAKCGKMEESMKQFEMMEARDVVTWNTIIAACGHCEDSSLGLRMISKMQSEGLALDVATILSALPLCSVIGAKHQGKQLHAYIVRWCLESNVGVGNALIEMYCRVGNLKYAVRVFKQMKIKDIITWTTLIYVYGMYGEGNEALRAFEEMKLVGISPDYVAFVSVLFACSHSGLVQEGRAYFNQMKKEYSIEPKIEHYACMVDLLSRSGQLAEAEKFILSMPLKPDATIWGALLSACRASSDVMMIERVSNNLLELNPNDPGYHVLVSNVYAALGKWEKVKTIRKSVRNRGLKKHPGSSWLEIRNKIYVFGAGERFYEQYQEVNEFLDNLSGLMAKEGYVADLRFALHDVEETEKFEMLSAHSERFAIAFGLLNTEPGVPLLIFKNLRVCQDCHTATKYISKIVQREILVRDANRFHLFKDGSCNCQDHW